MAAYRYYNVTITDLPVVATKIGRLLGVLPSGLSDAGNTTEVSFSVELTEQQKASLDAFMAGTNLDQLPTNTGNTSYLLEDLELVKTATGLDFDIYPTSSGYVIQFTKALTASEKNSFRGAVAGLLRQT